MLDRRGLGEVRHVPVDPPRASELIAAAERGQTTPPPPYLAEKARSEGWIHLPVKGFALRALR